MPLRHINMIAHFKKIIFYRQLLPSSYIFLLLIVSNIASSQTTTPEFPKGMVSYLGLQQGFVSNFHGSPAYYQIGPSFNPQFTVVPTLLRIGGQVGGVLAKNQWNIQAGPTINLRLFDVKAGSYGTIMNFQLTAAHLWGSYNEKLVGGGVLAEMFQLVDLSFTGYRDYGNNQWWLQSTIGYNIFRPHKKSTDPFKNL